MNNNQDKRLQEQFKKQFEIFKAIARNLDGRQSEERPCGPINRIFRANGNETHRKDDSDGGT